MLSLATFLISAGMTSAATNYLLSWSSVDGSREIDWGGSTVYSTQWYAGIYTWSTLNKIKIVPDNVFTIEDLTVSDVNRSDYDWYKTYGLTSHYPILADTLQLNRYLLDKSTYAQRQNTTTHELGHTLGLDHSFAGNVMYKYGTPQTVLGAQDIKDYRARWVY